MKYKVTLNGKVYEVEVEKGEAILVDEYEIMAPAAAPVITAAPAAAPLPAAAAGEVVTSPLPGNVLAIKTGVNQTVKKGDCLVIIEAMKMENEVFAPCDGRVVQIIAKTGTAVETGAPLVVLG